ncbi:hypothetical protein VNO80_02131 [Phaseolus coccineus]|uniref:Uncharacterized protein n=1 Tax=Phaseolus coccineus TaxID=3886 RepID=A0AAN9NTI4_PHACN
MISHFEKTHCKNLAAYGLGETIGSDASLDGDMRNWMHVKVCGEGRGSEYEYKVGKGLQKATLTAVCGGNTAGLC